MASPPVVPTKKPVATAATGEVIVTCECGQQMRAPASVLGTMGKCTLCGRAFRASAENSVPAPARETPAARRESTPAPKAASRIASMDQLRGYAIFGMIVVNFLGFFAATPWFLHHQRTTFSYADTIAPLFVFVVGMGFRLSMKRRAEKGGLAEARLHALKRYLILFAVAIAFYGPSYQKDWWDALTEIALAGLLTLPFIDKPAPIRLALGGAYLGLFTYFLLGTGYGAWLASSSMNGGPLGALGASFMLVCGTLAYDLLASNDTQAVVRWSLIASASLIAAAVLVWWLMPQDYAPYAGYGPYWPFAKRWGAAPFVLLSTGLCFAAFLFFYCTSDLAGFNFPGLSILGENPLVIYLVQYSLLEMNGVYLPESITEIPGPAGMLIALLGFTLFYGFVYAVAYRLHRDKIIIKL